MVKYSISENFTKTPGGRFRTDGPFSGEQFREEVLMPLFDQALKANDKLQIDLDGGYGYGSSFLEESFGGLQRIYTDIDILNTIEIVSDDDTAQIGNIKRYVQNAK